MTTDLYGLVAEKAEPNLIPANIKKNVVIQGVTGNYSGGVGTLWVGQSQNTYWSILTMPQYMVAMNYLYSLNTSLTAFVEYNWKLCVGIWMVTVSPTDNNTLFYNIDLTTWAITYIGSVSDGWSIYFWYTDMKEENWIIYRNYYDSDSTNYYNYEIDIDNGTISAVQPWRHITWNTPEDTSLTTWWKTYSIQAPISWEWLRTWNSWTTQIVWTWILVS